jgi:hypothetical protein
MDDDAVFDSMMSSDRRLKTLEFRAEGHNLLTELQVKRFWQIIEKFGKNLKEFHMSYQIQANIIQLLNLMPNLEFIDLELYVNSVSESKLELNKLRRIKCQSYSTLVIEIFEQLPPDVLEEIELFFGDQYEKKIFLNQKRIKKIKTSHKLANCFDWKNLKLKSLEFSNFVGFDHILIGQNQIETFKSYIMNQSSLNAICNEMTSLVHLQLLNLQVDGGESFKLWKLRNLKTLNIRITRADEIEINNFLSFLQNDNIENLTICGYKINLNELLIKQLAVNLPRLNYLHVTSQTSINAINAILRDFPNLEVLKFEAIRTDDEAFIFQNGLKHKKLKSLKLVMSKSDDIELPKLMNCCEKLENLEISSLTSKLSLLEQIKAPNLKSLTLKLEFNPQKLHSRYFRENFEMIDLSFLAIFKERYKNLNCFSCTSCDFSNGITQESIEKEFGEVFKIIRVREDYRRNHCNGLGPTVAISYLWEMKKF